MAQVSPLLGVVFFCVVLCTVAFIVVVRLRVDVVSYDAIGIEGSK